ncbi:hypothetical protein AMECASPLE_034226 [Ameca splendens]|uniref:Uncharacterized protein n=1 Tax=Ameca splendens TaxID=208324 RepID=A0ABV0Z517_9TELE
MPRQPSIDRDSLFAVLCTSKEAILLNGKIATTAATIWTELSQQLENKMSPKALYTFVKSNRYNIWSCLEVNEQESDHESSVDTEFDSGSISPGQDDCSGFRLEVPFEE